MLVYLVHNPDAVKHAYKIGCAGDPDWRLKQLRVSAPSVYLLGLKEGGRKEEKRLHDLLFLRRTDGEWFNLNDFDIPSLGFEAPDRFFEARRHLKRGTTAARNLERSKGKQTKPCSEAEKARRKERRDALLQIPEVRAARLEAQRLWQRNNRDKVAHYEASYLAKPENAARKKAAAAARRRRANPDVRAKRMASFKRRYAADPAFREQYQAYQKEYRSRPENVERMKALAREATKRCRLRKKAIERTATWFALQLAGIEVANGRYVY